MSEANKAVVRRLVDEVLTGGRLDAVDEIYTPNLAPAARAWIAPFRASFPDTRMEIVDLIAEGETVVARFTCSGTHLGPWLGHPPTGRRFEAVDEVSIFRFKDGQIAEAWGIEDNLGRLEQLGLLPAEHAAVPEAAASGAPPVDVACSLGEAELAERRRTLARDLFAHAERVEELADGYAWRFASDGGRHGPLLDLAAAERRCCPFFRIDLALEPNLGPVWLRLRGPAGSKGFVREAFGAV